MNQALEELQRDAFPAVAASRPSRALGTAVAVAAALMGGCLPAGSGAARLMLLVGGPCTEGGGKVVDKELTEPIRWGGPWRVANRVAGNTDAGLTGGGGKGMQRNCREIAGVAPTGCGGRHAVACPACHMHRTHQPQTVTGNPPPPRPPRSHKDLVKDAAPYYRKAKKFYDAIAAQLVAQGHSMDLFACSLDQVGGPPAVAGPGWGCQAVLLSAAQPCLQPVCWAPWIQGPPVVMGIPQDRGTPLAPCRGCLPRQPRR